MIGIKKKQLNSKLNKKAFMELLDERFSFLVMLELTLNYLLKNEKNIFSGSNRLILYKKQRHVH